MHGKSVAMASDSQGSQYDARRMTPGQSSSRHFRFSILEIASNASHLFLQLTKNHQILEILQPSSLTVAAIQSPFWPTATHP